MLQPLTRLTYKNVTSKWTGVKQKVFDEVKLIVTHNAVLAYTDFNNQSNIHMDTSDF